MEFREEFLMHYGVPGMKWGHRKSYTSMGSGDRKSRIAEAKANYKQAKKDFKSAAKAYRKNSNGFGIKGIAKAAKYERGYEEADLSRVHAKAQYKAAKARTSEKASKAEFNTYRQEMQKSGLRDSAADRRSNGRSTAIYNRVKAEKGKEYADRMEKKVQSTAVKTLVASAAVAVGSAAVSAWLNNK